MNKYIFRSQKEILKLFPLKESTLEVGDQVLINGQVFILIRKEALYDK